MEIHTNGMVNHFEVFQVGTFRKLVFAFHIHIIHQDVLIRANQRKDARTFYCVRRLLFIVIRFRPLSGGQRGSSSLLYAISIPFRFIEQVIKPVFIDDIAVNT